MHYNYNTFRYKNAGLYKMWLGFIPIYICPCSDAAMFYDLVTSLESCFRINKMKSY